MNRIRISTLLAVATLALPTSPVFAQRFAIPDPPPRSQVGAVNEGDDVQLCAAAPGGSRVRPNCEQSEQTTLRLEQVLKLSIELPAIPSTQCAATTTIEYQQRNTAARVDGAIAISECTAASGAFKVAVRVKDENGEEKSLEFPETWQRGDDKDVSFAADYPIGEAVELVSVRVRELTCTCLDPTATEASEP